MVITYSRRDFKITRAYGIEGFISPEEIACAVSSVREEAHVIEWGRTACHEGHKGEQQKEDHVSRENRWLNLYGDRTPRAVASWKAVGRGIDTGRVLSLVGLDYG